MITIISGTHRVGSRSLQFAKCIEAILNEKGISSQVLDLSKLPSAFVFENEIFSKENHVDMNEYIDRYVTQVDKFVFVIPEYNGSFPGVLKAFIDAFLPEKIRGKKAALVGISSGRAGNVRGMDHFSGVLNYLGVFVLPKQVAITHCHAALDEEQVRVVDDKTLDWLNDLTDQLVRF